MNKFMNAISNRRLLQIKDGLIRIGYYKQAYLQKAIKDIGQTQTEQELRWFVHDVSVIASDILSFVDMIHECDNRHNLLAVTVEDYPYEQRQKEIEELFESALEFSNYLLSLARRKGFQIDNIEQLKKTIAELNWMLEKDDSVYESEGYKRLAEEAIQEYKAGILEEWPK